MDMRAVNTTTITITTTPLYKYIQCHLQHLKINQFFRLSVYCFCYDNFFHYYYFVYNPSWIIHVHSLRSLFERLMSFLEAGSILCFLISSAISFEQLMNLKSHFHYLTNRASSGKDYSVWKTVNIF